jgi:tetratricopeptide (TPR) repeat protein
MRKSLKLLLTPMLFISLCLPVQADTFDQFQVHIHTGLDAIKNYNYDQALAQANSAEIFYRRTLQAYSHENSAEDLWKLNLAMQTNIVLLYSFLGQRLFDQKRYQDALRVYDKALAISPNYPNLRYEKGFTYFNLGQTWKATVELYEAKRLARFPARRNIINHFSEEGSLYTSRQEIDTRSDNLLKDMGKSADYPLDTDLETGKKIPGRIVPGMGVHWPGRGSGSYLYLDQDEEKISESLGEPTAREDIDWNDGKRVLMRYPELVLGLDPMTRKVREIHVSKIGYPVQTPKGYITIGAHAGTVLKQLGVSMGFDRTVMGINADPREYLSYTELGLIFAVSPNDIVSGVSITALE